jgi:hypothetical protein
MPGASGALGDGPARPSSGEKDVELSEGEGDTRAVGRRIAGPEERGDGLGDFGPVAQAVSAKPASRMRDSTVAAGGSVGMPLDPGGADGGSILEAGDTRVEEGPILQSAGAR